MTDNLLFELSASHEKFSEVFINKDIVIAYDNQNGVYSTNSINLDLSSISNQTRFTSYAEAQLNIPVVLTIRNTSGSETGNVALGGLAGPDFQSIVGLKNDFNSLIHSFTVKVNNTEVVSQTEFSSIPHTFKMLTELSGEEQLKIGPSIGFHKDNAESFSYAGNVVVNNGTTVSSNDGLEIRQKSLRVLSPDTTLAGTANAVRNTTAICTQDNFYQQFGIGAYATNASIGADTTPVNQSRVFYGVITVKLADMHDFFRQCPLMKGAYVVINLIVNQATVDFTYSRTNANPYTITAVNVPSSGICPIMLNGNPKTDTGATAQTTALLNANYRVSYGIARAFDSSLTNVIASHPIYNTIQLRVPQYDMALPFVEMYEKMRMKEIRYLDYQRPTIQTLGAGAQVNTQFSTGIARLRDVLICPFFAASSNGGIEVYQSPLTTEPATCSPYAHLGQYNILINGKPIYTADNKQYGYQQFLDEIAPLGVNGSLTRGITSGLISQKDWETVYGFYYTNTARRLPEIYESATSVSLQCSNKTKVPLNLFAYLCYEKRVVIDVMSGQVKSFV